MTVAAWLLGACGVILAGIGVFIVVLRAPLFAEDLCSRGRAAHSEAGHPPTAVSDRAINASLVKKRLDALPDVATSAAQDLWPCPPRTGAHTP